MSGDAQRPRRLEGEGSEARLRLLAQRFRGVSRRLDRRAGPVIRPISLEVLLLGFSALCVIAAFILIAYGT